MARQELATAPAQAPARAQPRRGRMLAALAYRDYRLLVTGNLFTQLGQWTQMVGMGWLVYQLTGSELQLTLPPFFTGVGMFLGAPIGGALADRFDRRKTIIVSQGALMAVALALAMMVATDHVKIWYTYITAFLSGAFFATNGPSRQSLVHDIVGKQDLANAIALNTVVMNSMRVIGPALGGLLLGTAGIEGTFFLQAGTYVAGMGMALAMHPAAAPEARHRDPFFKSMLEGARYARRDRTLSRLLVVAFVGGLLGASYMPLMPAYVGDVLAFPGKGSMLGWLMMTGGVGGLVGALTVAAAGDIRWKGKLLFASVTATGALQAVLGAVGFLDRGALWPAIPVLMGLGTTSAITLTMNNILIQTNVEDQYRGRLLSLYFLSFSLQPIGTLIGGAVAEVIGLQEALILLGCIVAAAMTFLAFTSPTVRRL